MALDFPSSPTLNQPYPPPPASPRWVWNGTSWVSAPIVTALYLPLSGGTLTGPGNLTVRGTTTLDDDATVDGDVTVTGGVTADHVTTTGTSLDVSGSATVTGTLTVAGDTEFKADVTINGVDVATETYVDQQVASGGLWQGTWDAENNVPDLTQAAVQLDGYTWAVVLSDPTASFTIPATPVLPGLNGAVVWTGYHVIWSTSASEFQVVPSGGMSFTQAQDTFLALTGGVMTTPGNITTPGSINLGTNGGLTAGSGGISINNGNFGLSGGGGWVSMSGSHFRTSINGSVILEASSGVNVYDPIIMEGSRFTQYGSVFRIDCSGLSNDIDVRAGGRGILLNGLPLATQQYVMNNQVTLAGGLPITGGTLSGPGGAQGNLTVNGALQVNNYAAVSTTFRASGTYFNVESDGSMYIQGMWPRREMYVDLNMRVNGDFMFNQYGGQTQFFQLGVASTTSQYAGMTYQAGSTLNFYARPNFYGGMYVMGDIATYNSWLNVGEGSYGIAFMDFQGSIPIARLRSTYDPVSMGAGPQSGIEMHASTFTVYGSTLKPGGGVWGTLSDARTKTDVHSYTSGLSELTKLEPITYRYNGRARMPEDGKIYIGLKAEEAADVMPEMVRKVRGKLDYDDDETDILHLDSTALAFATINALKEITKRLEILEAKLK